MTCCHKCKICTQLCCGQNVKFDLRFGRKPVSSLTGLLQCCGYIAKQNLCNARELDTAARDMVRYHMSLIIQNLNYKITSSESPNDVDKLRLSHSIIYITVQNRKWIYLFYWEIQLHLNRETMGKNLKNKIICWFILCKTSAVNLFNKFTNHSRCL